MSTSPETAPEPIEIRRYSNRRYYDTSRSKHITLEGIRDLIRSGAHVRIVDADTGDDLTPRILTQIILEYDTPKIAVLPPDLLHRLIRSSEPLLMEFMEQYFSDAMELFENSQRTMREQWSRLTGLPGSPQDLAQMWQAAWGGATPPGPTPQPAATPTAPEPTKSADDLRREVAELQKQLAQVQSAMQDLGPDTPESSR